MPESPHPASAKRVAVIGGGITGLAAAHRLREIDAGAEVVVFEAGDRIGGVLQTTQRDGYLVEHSADNFITNVPWAMNLCRRIGFDKQLLPTDDRYRKAYVAHEGELVPVPEGFALLAPARVWPVLTTPLLSVGGKLRLAWEFFLPPSEQTGDESLESFAVRRLGREAFERIVQPLVGGIYTADPARLSLSATLPRFLEMERQQGGLIRGALAQDSANRTSDKSSSGARYSLFVAPRDGMESLVSAVAARLPQGTIRLNSRVQNLRRTEAGGWEMGLADGAACESFDGLIVTTRAPIASGLLGAVDADLAELLGGIPYAGASVVCLGYAKKNIAHPLDGFGFVVPAVENRRILAGSFSSVKYPGRAPDNCVLIRVFVGGALQPELAELPDDELIEIACQELHELIGARGEPQLTQVVRWHGAMPQYHLGHLDRVAQIEARAAALPGLEIAGNAYRGVGVPQCIHAGEAAAERLLDQIPSLARRG